MPFPREDAVMTIYDGRPSSVVRRMSNLSPRTPTCYGWGRKDVRTQFFSIFLYINICRNMDMYITATPKAKEKTTDGIAGVRGDTRRAKF
jgi:hypothetical protein